MGTRFRGSTPVSRPSSCCEVVPSSPSDSRAPKWEGRRSQRSRDWAKRRRETGSVAPAPIGGYVRLEADVERHEIPARLDVEVIAVEPFEGQHHRRGCRRDDEPADDRKTHATLDQRDEEGFGR